MGALKLKPDPTFKAKVNIAVAGAADVSVEWTFKHRTRDELKSFIDASAERDDVTSILEMCSGWELSDPFTRESIDSLVQNYIAAPRSVFDAYVDELTKARTKN